MEQQCATAAHWTEQQYRDAFEPGEVQRLVLVAGDSGSVLGFLVALHIAPEWELENIAVVPAGRRRGLGKLLLNTLLDRARETNSEAVFLEVRKSNAAARAFYKKLGFQGNGRRKNYYTNPLEDAVLYRYGLR